MPYIPQKDRTDYDPLLKVLFSRLSKLPEEKLVGHLNYCFSVLAWNLYESKPSYSRANAIEGVFTAADKEFYRRQISPYEDDKIDENGDLPRLV
jgi:hypothetical protein